MTATNPRDRPPVPGMLPERARLNGNTAGLTAPTKKRDVPKRGRENPARTLVGKLVSALRGDKYMVDAYPAAGREALPSPDDRGWRARER